MLKECSLIFTSIRRVISLCSTEISVGSNSLVKHRQNVLVGIVGTAGSGKLYVTRKFEEAGFKHIPLCTDRAPRYGEIDGVDFCFVSKDYLVPEYREGSFVSCSVFDDAIYGMSRMPLDADYVVPVGYCGALRLCEIYGRNFIIVKLAASSKMCMQRYKEAGKVLDIRRIWDWDCNYILPFWWGHCSKYKW